MFLTSKTCQECKVEQPSPHYQANGRGGLRPTCKHCMSVLRAAKRGKIEQKSTKVKSSPKKAEKVAKKIQTQPKPLLDQLEKIIEENNIEYIDENAISVKIPITAEGAITLDDVIAKYGKTVVHVAGPGRPSTLQIFGNPVLSYKGTTKEVLEMAMG